MSTQPNLTDATKMETIKKAIGNGNVTMRRAYPTYAAALAAFTAASALATAEGLPVYATPETTTTTTNGEPILNKKGEPTGEFQQVETTVNNFDNSEAVVAVVGSRTRNSKGAFDTGIRAVVLFPVPTAAAFIADSEESQKWVAKVIQKEACHVAFRQVRNADSAEALAQAATSMPISVGDFIAMRDDGINTDTFDTLWKPFRALLKEHQPELVANLPTKAECLKAIRSKPYALSQPFAAFESNGIFAWMLDQLINGAATWKNNQGDLDPLDATSLVEWKETRDTAELKKVEATEKDFSIAFDTSVNVGF